MQAGFRVDDQVLGSSDVHVAAAQQLVGGRVDAAIQIRDALLEAKPRTVAFIHPRAISAGALISLACDNIIMTEGGTICAATPIQGGAGQAEAVVEKMVS